MTGAAGGWGALGFGAVLVLGTSMSGCATSRSSASRPGPGWQRTTERFFDEDSGKTVTVYIHPETGERRYVED